MRQNFVCLCLLKKKECLVQTGRSSFRFKNGCFLHTKLAELSLGSALICCTDSSKKPQGSGDLQIWRPT